MMNQYETVFILTPVLPEEQVKDTVEKFKQILANQEAEVVHEENWGLRKLAYPIKKKSTGFYTLLQFKAKPEVVKVLETEYRRDERVMRHLVVKLDKYAVEYAERRIAKKFGKNEEAVAE